MSPDANACRRMSYRASGSRRTLRTTRPEMESTRTPRRQGPDFKRSGLGVLASWRFSESSERLVTRLLLQKGPVPALAGTARPFGGRVGAAVTLTERDHCALVVRGRRGIGEGIFESAGAARRLRLRRALHGLAGRRRIAEGIAECGRRGRLAARGRHRARRRRGARRRWRRDAVSRSGRAVRERIGEAGRAR